MAATGSPKATSELLIVTSTVSGDTMSTVGSGANARATALALAYP